MKTGELDMAELLVSYNGGRRAVSPAEVSMAGGSVSLGSQPAFLQEWPTSHPGIKGTGLAAPWAQSSPVETGNIFSALLDIFPQTACALGKVPC